MTRPIFILYDAPQTYEREGLGHGFHWFLWRKLAPEFPTIPIHAFFSKPLPEVTKKKMALKAKHKDFAASDMTKCGKYWLPSARLAEVRAWRDRLPASAVVLGAGDIATTILTDGASDSCFTWNGSIHRDAAGRYVIPVIGPETVAKDPKMMYYTSAALRRAMGLSRGTITEVTYDCRVVRTWDDFRGFVSRVPDGHFEASIDLETKNYEILSFGIRLPDGVAYSIPLTNPVPEDSAAGHELWSKQQWLEIRNFCCTLMNRPGMTLIFQNGYYDLTYLFWKWMFWPSPDVEIFDTIIAAHVTNPEARRGLDILAQLHLPWYVYWKDEGRQNDQITATDWARYWRYNALDCHHTFDIAQQQRALLRQKGLTKVCDMQHEAYLPTLAMSCYGWAIDMEKREELLTALARAMDRPMNWLKTARVPYTSPKKMGELLYGAMGIKPELDRKTRRPTTNDDALENIMHRKDVEPLALPILKKLQRVRSIKVMTDGIGFRVSEGNRAYASFRLDGADTFRLSSARHIFGTGHNFQNKSKGNTWDNKKGVEILPHDPRWEPNARQLFLFDPGFQGFECDQERADLQVVVWEADDRELKEMLRSGEDMHAHNAVAMFGGTYAEHTTDGGRPGSKQRQLMKAGVHATNYGVQANTLATTLGVTRAEADNFINMWLYKIHPGIGRWHTRIKLQVEKQSAVYNAYGYRRLYLERPTLLTLQNALAWIAQSTVAIVSQRALLQFNATVPKDEGRILHQNHDSLNPQIRADRVAYWEPQLAAILKNPVPYPDPLVIGWSVNRCGKSWGDH